MKTFYIRFLDILDDKIKERYLEAERIEHACAYMKDLGCEIITIKEVA